MTTDRIFVDITDNGPLTVQVTDTSDITHSYSIFTQCFDRQPPTVG